ncbi:tripartite tricarboxylate transporter permease [Pelagibius sp.]|uniref:tripartite tricarboxylate transporter permease n=1 Tax=Pelagibius sp. TaxID=1931238 RepID=UPI00262FB9F3|nr:tripartite tricarboxylate transporter permease [Pelagibius sp.]
MDAVVNWAADFAGVLTLQNLLLCFTGALVGTVVGVLPGIGPAATLALLLPLTFTLDPAGALIMLAAIYYGAQYGSSTTAILLNLPGESSGVVTALDGHRMALAGRAGPAIAIAALSSLFAGLASAVFIALVAGPIAQWSLLIAPAGLAGLIALGLFAAAIIAPGKPLAALTLILFGTCLGLVGTDSGGGMPRFTLGITELRDGIGFMPLVMGLFAIAELIRALESGSRPQRIAPLGLPWPTRADLKAAALPTLRGTGIGGILGVIPGVTTVMSALAARGLERAFRTADRPLGEGAVAGVSAPEAANNASAQSALIPLLTLGLPGNPVIAVLAGALMIHGIAPGPSFIDNNPDLFAALIASLVVGNVILVVLNLPLAGLWASLLRVPFPKLVPLIIVFSLIGVYSVQNSLFDVWLMLAFGALGWLLVRLGLEPTPIVLGFILGPAFEEYLRRSLLFSRGDPSVFLSDPVSLTSIAIIVGASAFLMLRRTYRR